MKLPKLIDNFRTTLADTLRIIAKKHKHLSIATGYWDIQGTLELIDSIKDYESIRLIIGQEPIYNSYLKRMGVKVNLKEIEESYPDIFFRSDLEQSAVDEELRDIRNTVVKLSKLIEDGKLQVKVFKKPILHAKAYIFGNYSDEDAIGIVGSSNFTRAGLTGNAELNSLEDEFRIVTFQPLEEGHEHGHLSWFDSFWNHQDAIEWSGEFRTLLQNSPIGDLTYGAYDVYIKSLMEVYPDELDPPIELEKETADILYAFQNRNAGILINKLNKMGLAILSDSVGLGKTITAGAVVKYYLDKAEGKANVQIIAPASLKQQWIDDLSSVLGVDKREGAFNIVSQQDINAIQEIYEYYDREWRKSKNIDLFIIDEAHNLRSNTGKRHDTILKLLQQHPKAHILLLTATPINNSLMDIVYLIQLATKGSTKSVSVSYVRPNGRDTERLDFFDAVKRIQTQIRIAEKRGQNVDDLLNTVKPTIHEGLRHYLVRSTRQGVEAEGSIVDRSGNPLVFPKSIVESIDYQYDDKITEFVYKTLMNNVDEVFEGIDPTSLNLLLLSECTQQSSHPLDFIKRLREKHWLIHDIFDIDEDIVKNNGSLFFSEAQRILVPNILQAIYLLGFTAYRPGIYQNRYYGKNISDLKSFETLPNEIAIQLTVHNILHVTWLKRLESSPTALLISIENYRKRLELFKKYLEKGFVVSLGDVSLLESDYNDGEDIEQAFNDFDKYLKERDEWLSSGKDIGELKKYGVEKIYADPDQYNVNQIKVDLYRDSKILDTLSRILTEASRPANDIKMQNMADHIHEIISSGEYGKKVLVFSFFADTVNHLRENLTDKLCNRIENFDKKAEFITGSTMKTEEIVRRFSPKSKKYVLKPEEVEVNFLFSTDVLSEGQNLQDAGYLINYDLHWNPVRMIQRNGRINRLGSVFTKVLIANMKPTNELEMYLKLVHRLESKIRTIRNTIGLDQSVLSNSDINPIEFVEKYYRDGVLPDQEDDILAHTDDHILELRKFLGENKDNYNEISRVRNISKGKWNYLPSDTNLSSNLLSLISIVGHTTKTQKQFTDLFFIELLYKDKEYIASYIDYVKALDAIKTSKDNNERRTDNIIYERKKVISRSIAEATRQANNPEVVYRITPQYERALATISEYFTEKIDIKGIIENGVNRVNIQSDLEKVLKQINHEKRSDGSVSSTTINKFMKILRVIINTVTEEKEVTDSETILVYSKF
jgi:ERCC4-related helicase